jgi:hypothetical protein
LRADVAVASNDKGGNLPGLLCEFGVGVGRTGRGDFTENGEVPLERVTVLATARSGPDGSLALDVPESYFHEDQLVSVFGRVVEPGYAQRNTGFDLFDAEARSEGIRVVARKGGTLRGRVVGPLGEAVASDVALVVTLSDGNLASLVTTRTTRDGRFEVSFEKDEAAVLVARAEGLGTATSGELQLRAAMPPGELQLALGGSGTLEGVVLDKSGAPVPNYSLWAGAASVATDGIPTIDPVDAVGLELAGEGLVQAVTSTDEEGRFHFTGLMDQPLVVRGSRGGRRRFRRLLSPEPVAAGSTDVRFVLERRTLVVSVEDTLGRSLRPGLEIDQEAGLPPFVLFCQESDAEGRIESPQRFHWVDHHWGLGNEVVFEVEPGMSYALGVAGTDCVPFETVVTVAEQDRELRRTIRLAPLSEFGQVEVRLEGPGGRDPKGTNKLVLSLPMSRLEVAHVAANDAAPELVTRLAPGRYPLSGQYVRWVGMHGGADSEDPYGAIETEIEVEAGATTQRTLRLIATGGLEVHVRASGPPDLATWPVTREPTPSRSAYDPMATRVRLEPKDGRESTTLSFYSRSHRTHDGPLLGETLPATSKILVGEYRLTAEVPGYPPLETTLTVREGETTRIELEF